jgi:hypothetical protein
LIKSSTPITGHRGVVAQLVEQLPHTDRDTGGYQWSFKFFTRRRGDVRALQDVDRLLDEGHRRVIARPSSELIIYPTSRPRHQASCRNRYVLNIRVQKISS